MILLRELPKESAITANLSEFTKSLTELYSWRAGNENRTSEFENNCNSQIIAVILTNSAQFSLDFSRNSAFNDYREKFNYSLFEESLKNIDLPKAVGNLIDILLEQSKIMKLEDENLSRTEQRPSLRQSAVIWYILLSIIVFVLLVSLFAALYLCLIRGFDD